MRRQLRAHTGFSLIEILIAISLLAVIATLFLVGFRQYLEYQKFNQSVRELEFILLESQTNARLSVGGNEHGVSFGTATVTQFVGSVYTPSDPTNEIKELFGVTLTPSLTGGTKEIVFSILNGYPSATGTIVVTGTQYNGSSSIEITASGVVQ